MQCSARGVGWWHLFPAAAWWQLSCARSRTHAPPPLPPLLAHTRCTHAPPPPVQDWQRAQEERMRHTPFLDSNPHKFAYLNPFRQALSERPYRRIKKTQNNIAATQRSNPKPDSGCVRAAHLNSFG